jgi:glyoxylase-like metal-dependent hydrolase (beta-lactamase superfamily II)
LKIKSFIVGLLATNCYVVSEFNKEAIIIDPGFETKREFNKIEEFINENSLKVKLVINTHGHSDHISGNSFVQKNYDCPIGIHINDSHFLNNIIESSRIILLNEEDFLDFGKNLLRVIFTPGHTPGGISLIGNKVVFTGDTLFSKGIGRMDFPGGSREDMKRSLMKIMSLPEDYVVFSGHGVSTTIGEEKNNNMFLSWL